MKRLAAFSLIIGLLVPVAVAAQVEPESDARNEAVYQGLWCLYLNAHPYYLDAPPDVSCEFEARSMTVEEAGAYYLLHVGRHNQVIDLWNCADDKAKNGLSWKQDRKWANKRMRGAVRGWGESLAAVMWPDEAKRTARKLADAAFADAYRMRDAYNYRTAARSVLSGDWARYLKAGDKAGELAGQLRLRLGLKQPPRKVRSCKVAKKYQRQQAKRPVFTKPHADRATNEIAALLVDAGLAQTQVNESDAYSLFLTEAGLEAARAMPGIDDEAEPSDVVSALFAPVESLVVEPSPEPELAELAPST